MMPAMNLFVALSGPKLREAASFTEITGANAGERHGFAGKSRVLLRPRPGVAHFHRWCH